MKHLDKTLNLKKLTAIILLFTLYSCGKINSDKKKLSDSDMLCGRAKITKILGNNNYFGGGNDIIVKCYVEYNDLEFESELIIDVSFVGEAYCPFKVGDIVLAKFLKQNKQKTAEMYLLERYNPRNGYKWESLYTFDEACNGNFSEGVEQQKVFSVKGKI